MKDEVKIINGNYHTDERGTISFVNSFDMSPVKRFYVIEHPKTEIIRAWRAHKIEQRWFHVSSGEFLVRIVKIDNWKSPDVDTPITDYLLSAESVEVLHVPSGYGTWIQALKEGSKMIIFADYGIENAKEDDHLFPLEYFEYKK